MRKKIFVIHGKGVTNGIGREGGGDLDTVSSNAFYMAWASGSAREEGREAVYGQDFEFGFLNYSEGVSSLLAYPGCDVYIPDFPIDALASRLKLLHIEDEPAIGLLNRFTRETDDFRRWIVGRAGEVSAEAKEIFNNAYKQIGKVLEHQETAALQAALAVLGLTRGLLELDILLGAGGSSEASGLRQGVIGHLGGSRLRDLKKNLLGRLKDSSKEKMIDLSEAHDAILAFDDALAADMSTSGRINYTDEFLVVMVEIVAYLVRGYHQLRTLPWDKEPAEAFAHTLSAIRDDVGIFLRTLESLLDQGDASLPEAAHATARGMGASVRALKDIFAGIGDNPAPAEGGKGNYPLVLLLVEDATGQAVPGVEVVIRRLAGKGGFLLPDGRTLDEERIAVPTGEDGSIRIFYRPASPEENFRISITFDELQELILPPESTLAPDEIESAAEAETVAEEALEEAFEEKDLAPADPGADRSMRVSLALIERQFRALAAADVRVISIDDHHPYTREIFDLLGRLVEDGVIGNLQVASLPRGEELPVEKQKCGADLIYAARVRGKPWDNPGLEELSRIAHLQDLHIELTALGIDISKLIGSRHSKVLIAQGLASVKTLEEMRSIMARMGWDKLVAAYDASLEEVYPRVEQAVGVIEFAKPGSPDPVRITAALSPFCDGKKGEVQINVASAIHYLLGRKKNPTDYFFYCYGSQLMTTRRPNEKETSLNLSTMCQHIGTRADGGHSGAATCKPSSNPAFPRRRLLKIKDTNYLHYLDYLADRVADYSGLVKLGVRPLDFASYSPPVEAALKHVEENLFRIRLEVPAGSGAPVTVLFTRAPRVLGKAGEEKPSFFQIFNYLKRSHEFDYLFLAQGMLYRVILANAGDKDCRLDLPELSRRIGWSEDGGCSILAVADIKKNKQVKKRLRRMLPPHLVQLSRLIGSFLEASGAGALLENRPLVTEGALATFAAVLSRLDSETWLVELTGDGGRKLRLAAVLGGRVNRKAGEADIPIPLIGEHLKEHKPDYLFFSEGDVSFPRQQGISVLARLGDGPGPIDCARTVEALLGKRFCGDAGIAEFMPRLVPGSPLGQAPLTAANFREYLDFILPRLAAAAGFEAGEPRKA